MVLSNNRNVSKIKTILTGTVLVLIISLVISAFKYEEVPKNIVYGRVCPSPQLTTDFINDLAFFIDLTGKRVCNIISDGFVINTVCLHAFSNPYIGFSGFVENETTAKISSVSFDDDGDGVYDRSTNDVRGIITLKNKLHTFQIDNLIIGSDKIGLFFEGRCLVQKAEFKSEGKKSSIK